MLYFPLDSAPKPITFLEHLESKKVPEKETVSFQCELQDEPDESVEITWLKAGQVIPESEKVRKKRSIDN